MSDAIRKVITANQVKHGAMIASVMPNGVAMDRDETDVTNNNDPAAVFTKLNNRFDDPRYYAGDTAS